ncbi:MAG: ABC transporter permease [Solirubrobacteraceae bacterium]
MGAETVRLALTGIYANKLRSGLTILGLTIGVASVIVLIAVGNGSQKAVQASIEALGTNVLLVEPGFSFGGSSVTSISAPVSLTTADADAFANKTLAPDVQSAAPSVSASPTLVYDGTSYSPSQFVGTTPAYAGAHDYSVQTGGFFTSAEVKDHARVVVLGPTVVTNLFDGADPVGDTIQINGVNFEVVGVTVPKGTNGLVDEDDVAFAPITTVQDELTGYGSVDSITVRAKSSADLNAADAEVTSILEQRDDITDTANPGFRVINQGSLLTASSSTSSVFTTLLGEVAAISLLVGGIGVMNIMLVSVTERTREIGIRKAIGARRGDILTQFLTEAVLVSIFGGLAGVLLGVVGSQFTIAGVHPAIELYSVFLAFGAALLTGLVFGTYPASRAAAMRPIEALRFE